MLEIEKLNEVICMFVKSDSFAKIIRNHKYSHLSLFPRGWCTDACEILLNNLKEINKFKFKKEPKLFKNSFQKKYSEIRSHVVLENHNFIVDITAHQFNETLGTHFPEIIVCKKKDYLLNKYLDMEKPENIEIPEVNISCCKNIIFKT